MTAREFLVDWPQSLALIVVQTVGLRLVMMSTADRIGDFTAKSGDVHVHTGCVYVHSHHCRRCHALHRKNPLYISRSVHSEKHEFCDKYLTVVTNTSLLLL